MKNTLKKKPLLSRKNFKLFKYKINICETDKV